MVEYKVVPMDEAIKQGLPGTTNDEYYGFYEPEDVSGLWLFRDGTAEKLIATDGGEPEDNTFRRDWSWVAGELNKAYQMGRVDKSYE